MVQYTDLFTPHHIATLVEWFEEKGELLIQMALRDLYTPFLNPARQGRIYLF
jgi:hypothetical protein